MGGLSICLLCGIGSAAAIARRREAPPRIMLEGCIALVAGGVVTIIAIASRAPTVFLAGTAIAGIGFGPAFLGAFRTVVALAPADDRAGLVAAIFIDTYFGFGSAALAAGFATSSYGLRPTALVYCTAVVILAGIATASLLVRKRAPAAEMDSAAAARPAAAFVTRAHCSAQPDAGAVP